MNRFDSAFSSSQRNSGPWLRSVLMAVLFTVGMFSASSLYAQVAVTINRVSPAGNINQACEGQQVAYNTYNYNDPNVTYTWTVVGGFFVNGVNTGAAVTVQWQNTGNQTLSVTRNYYNGFNVASASINVAVSRMPTPAIGGSNVVCVNSEQTYSTPAVAGSTYAWTITPSANWVNIGGAPPGANFINVRWIQTGNATVSVTETAVGGVCSATVSATVIVNPVPAPNIQSTNGYGNPSTRRPGIVCANTVQTYFVGATPGNVFQWTVTGGTILSGQNTSSISVQWGAAGTGTLACRESVPGSATCITTDLDSINIRSLPTPAITGSISACSNVIQDYTTPIVSGNSYTWTVVGGSYSLIAANTARVSWTAPVWPNTGTGTVSVTESVIDVLPTSCASATTTTVTVRPVPPTPVISGPATFCATNLSTNPATNYTATYTSSIPSTTAGSGTIAYTWTVTGGTITGGQGTSTITVQWSNAGSSTTVGTIALKHTSSFGCEATGTLNVVVNPLPAPSVRGAAVACQNTIENYSTTGIPGNSYTWSLTGGNFIRAGQGTPNVAVEWTLPGSATLTVTETNLLGCTVQNAFTVTVNPLPAAALRVSGPTTFCPTGDITICAPIGFTKYVWNTGETARCIVARTSGKYWCTVTNTNNCSKSSDTVTLNVLAGPQPVIALGGPTTFCQGGNVTLTAPAGFSAYRWSTGESSQSINVSQAGAYTVTVADGNGCTGTSAEVEVTVNPTPSPKLAVTGNVNFCAGDSVVINAPAGYASYAWVSSTGASYPTQRNITVKASDTVYCVVVDIFGCSGNSDTIRIKTPPVVKPTITAVGSTTFCDGGSVKLVAQDGFNSYIWSNGSNGKEVTVNAAGDYYVTVVDKATNCPVASAVVKVVVNETPGKPTISREGDVLTAKTTATNVDGWAWSRNGTEIVGATSNQYKVSMPGVYTATVKVPGCSATSNEFEVVFTGVNEDVVAGESVMAVYPNPTTGRVTLSSNIALTGAVRIDVTNALGERVLSINEAANGSVFATTFDMTNLAGGVYNVALTAGGDTYVVSVVRQ